MKKGFTLIELLGVMVILSILLLIIMPNIINSMQKANEDNSSITAKLVYNAAKKYIEGSSKYKERNNNTYCITIRELIDDNLLDAPVKYGDEFIEDTKSVKATYNDKWHYEIVDRNSCSTNTMFTCNRTNSANVTTGFIPNNKYEVGDEYICKVNASTSYHFFILSVSGNRVSLIADRNLDSDGTLVDGNTYAGGWSNSNNNSSGPVAAYEYLENSLSGWVNIPVITRFNFVDINKNNIYGYKGISIYNFNNNYITKIYDKNDQFIEYNNIVARLPLYTEITSLGCSTTSNSCPNWLSNYLNSSGDVGYWLLDSALDENDKAYIVSYDKKIDTLNSGNNTAGIRPVIELTRDDLE